MVTRSTVEAKFKAMVQGICELIWLKILLGELCVTTTNPILLYYDNKAIISIVQNLVHHDKTKHVKVNCNFIKEKIESRMLNMVYKPTREQATDILTKRLPRQDFNKLTSKLGLQDT